MAHHYDEGSSSAASISAPLSVQYPSCKFGVDSPTMESLYRRYVCHCCGHQTVYHVLGLPGTGQFPVGPILGVGRLVCTHKELFHVPKTIPLEVFGSNNIPEFTTTYDVEERTCKCALEITSDDFQLVHKRHMEYCGQMDELKADMLRDKLMEMCRTEL